jgi:phage tail sheath protein FI
MSAQKMTPGVYVEELNAFPNSVVEVATAVPAFIGYTELAMRGTRGLVNKPTRIASFAEYTAFFGGPPPTKVQLSGDGTSVAGVDRNSRFFLFASVRLYFDNGGGPCYIVSVGKYADAMKDGKSPGALHGDGLAALEKALEPTMVVVPDAVLLDQSTDSRDVAQQVLQHCHDMQSRIGIFDVFEGDKPRTNDEDDVISGDAGFRSLNSDFVNYGVAYYPWLNTSLIEESEVDYSRVVDGSRAALVANLKAQAAAGYTDVRKLQSLSETIDKLGTPDPDPITDDAIKLRRTNHKVLAAALPGYKTLMNEVRAALNIVPPSGGIAGVYARIDSAIGVQKAPANTGINSVVSPVVDITSRDQEDLNMPLDGKAVNAIRTLPGRGMLIWGARTLDGNSQDWRYVNVRRTMIMLEQSIKAAAQAYVFEPNTALTWSTVKNMIINFLTNQWKAGVLMGSKAEDAFSVDVGLGSTMTGDDVLDGYMRVVVKVCVVHPAEFIVITFQQLMPKS